MKCLWICNVVIPDFCEEYRIKKTVIEGWITGMFHQIRKRKEWEIGFCFPIIDDDRLKDGIAKGCNYYSFKMGNKDFESAVDRFKAILIQFNPDVVHLWGTEYAHFLAAMQAGIEIGIREKFLIHIQGLVSIYAKHFNNGLPENLLTKKMGKHQTLSEFKDAFVKRGKSENAVIKLADHILGRTEWDKACTRMINPKSKYYFCSEILRDSFYSSKRKWKFSKCKIHSIFVSQAFYPVKGFHFLLESADILRKKYDDLRIYIAGMDVFYKDSQGKYSPYGEYILKLIEEYSLKEHLVFLGLQQEHEMLEWYLRTNVFVMSSTIENSPNSIAEAMFLGTPVVASYVGGMPSLIKHGETGFLYPCEETYMLAYYIERCFEYNEQIEQMSYNEIEVAKERYDLDKAVDQLLNVYNTISVN